MAGNENNTRDIQGLASQADIERVRTHLAERPRNLLLFELAIQTGSRMKDLLQLKVSDILGFKAGDRLPIGNVGQNDGVLVTNAILKAVNLYFDELHPRDENYLFSSRKGQKPLNLSSASDLINSWFRAAGLEGLCGARSLRKTWELHFRTQLRRPTLIEGDVSPAEGFELIERVTLQEEVHQKLIQAITSGKLRPGQRIIIGVIAKEMGVSHMTVREALLRLQGAGLLARQQNRGYAVKGLSEDDLKEIYEMRIVLESLAVEKACLMRTLETIELLEKHLETMTQSALNSYVDDFFAAHAAFHLALCRDSNMPNLLAVISSQLERVRPYLHVLVRGYSREEVLFDLEQHRNMVDGLRRQDVDNVWVHLKSDLTEAMVTMIDKLSVRSTVRRVFKIGLCMTFTGSSGSAAVAYSNGCRLVADRINARGGLKIGAERYHIRFFPGEANFSSEGAASMAKNLIEKDRVDMIVGAMVTQTTLGVHQVTEPNKVITLNTGMADEVLQLDYGARYSFRSYISISETFPRLFEWLARNYPHKKKIALTDLNYESSWRGQEMVRIVAPEYGFEVVYSAFHPGQITDFAQWITSGLEAESDIVMNVGSFPEEWGLKIAQWRRMGFNGIFVECLPPTSSVLRQKAAIQDVEGLIGVDYASQGANANSKMVDFRRKYSWMYGEWNPFSMLVAPAFEAVLQAYEEAGSFDADQVVKVLESGRRWKTSLGITGLFGGAERYSQPHQWLSPQWIHQVAGGEVLAVEDGEIRIENMTEPWCRQPLGSSIVSLGAGATG